MPSKKRKADEEASNDGITTAVSPLKKSKKEIIAEGRARAAQYAASLKAKKLTSTQDSPSTTVSSNDAKLRRKTGGTSRKSTGGISARNHPESSQLKGKRKSLATPIAFGDSRNNKSEFQFLPPDTEPSKMRTEQFGPNGTPVMSTHTNFHTSSAPRQEFEQEDENLKKQTPAHKKKEKLQRAQAYKNELQKKKQGVPVKSDSVQSTLDANVALSIAGDIDTADPGVASDASTNIVTLTRNSYVHKQSPSALADAFSPHQSPLEKPSPSSSFDLHETWSPTGCKLPTTANARCGPTPSSHHVVSPIMKLAHNTTSATTTTVFGTTSNMGYGMQELNSFNSVPLIDPPQVRYKREDFNPTGVRKSEPPGNFVGNDDDDLKRHAMDPPEPVFSEISVHPTRETINKILLKDENTSVHGQVLRATISKAKTMFSSIPAFSANDEVELKNQSTEVKTEVAAERMICTSEYGANVTQSAQEVTVPVDPPSIAPPSENSTFLKSTNVNSEINKTVDVDEAHAATAEENDGFVIKQYRFRSIFKRCFKRICSVVLFLIIIEISYMIYHFVKDDNTDHMNTRSPSPSSSQGILKTGDSNYLCFVDYPSDFIFSGDDQHESGKCDGILMPCPQWGRCHGGKLRDCNDVDSSFQNIMSRYVPSERRDMCIPSPQALELMTYLQKTLLSMTVAQKCHSQDELSPADVNYDNLYPMFRLEKVVEKMKSMVEGNIDMNSTDVSSRLLLWLEPLFDTTAIRFGSLSDQLSLIDSIGLGLGVPPNSLPFPVSCSLKIMLWELFEYCIECLIEAIASIVIRLFNFVLHYPTLSVFFLVLLKLISVIRQRRYHLAKVHKLFGTVLEAAYDRLAECEDNDGYAALMLRDDIGVDMYPTNMLERNFLYNEIWPRVVLEMHADNRVRKFRKDASGKNLEHWDFHTKPKMSRRLRKPLGSVSNHRVGVSTK